jgi:uncharacterized SAM-dependent methyltransferase
MVNACLKKDIVTASAAYDHRAGVIVKFDLNLLACINPRLGADFVRLLVWRCGSAHRWPMPTDNGGDAE